MKKVFFELIFLYFSNSRLRCLSIRCKINCEKNKESFNVRKDYPKVSHVTVVKKVPSEKKKNINFLNCSSKVIVDDDSSEKNSYLADKKKYSEGNQFFDINFSTPIIERNNEPYDIIKNLLKMEVSRNYLNVPFSPLGTSYMKRKVSNRPYYPVYKQPLEDFDLFFSNYNSYHPSLREIDKYSPIYNRKLKNHFQNKDLALGLYDFYLPKTVMASRSHTDNLKFGDGLNNLLKDSVTDKIDMNSRKRNLGRCRHKNSFFRNNSHIHPERLILDKDSYLRNKYNNIDSNNDYRGKNHYFDDLLSAKEKENTDKLYNFHNNALKKNLEHGLHRDHFSNRIFNSDSIQNNTIFPDTTHHDNFFLMSSKA